MEQWHGELPSTLPDLLRIPGIGRSTAGAILSLAFEIPTPILDGNVKRVTARLFALPGDPDRPKSKKKLWEFSAALTPEEGVHDYTQAVMDLGAMICLPRNPLCPDCPLRKGCAAFRQNRQGEIPASPKKKSLPHHNAALGVIRKGGRILIYQRPLDGLLGGLWGFPNYRSKTKKGLSDTLQEGVEKDYGIRIEPDTPFGTLSHAYSHFKITLHISECFCKAGEKIEKKVYPSKWVYPSVLVKYPLAATDLKVIKKITGDRVLGAAKALK